MTSAIYEIRIESEKIMKDIEKRKSRVCFHGPIQEKTYVVSHTSFMDLKTQNIPFQIIKIVPIETLNIPVIHTFPAILMDQPTKTAYGEAMAYAYAWAAMHKAYAPVSIAYLGRNADLSQYPDAFILDEAGGKRRYAWALITSEKQYPEFSMEKNFSSMKQTIQDPDTKVILALGGGGLKGLAHSTLMKFLNTLGVYSYLDELWGTSVGSLAALWYACNIDPGKMQKSGYDLYNQLFQLKLNPNMLDVLKNLLVHFCLPERLQPSGFSGFVQCTKSLEDYIYSLKKDLPIIKPFYCIAFNIRNFKSEVLTSEKVDTEMYHGKIYHVNPIEAVVASSAVPILFIPKTIQREDKSVQYIDGGIGENTPMKSVYEKWKIDRALGKEQRKKLLIIASGLSSGNTEALFNYQNMHEGDILKLLFKIMGKEIELAHQELLSKDPNVSVWHFQIPLDQYPSFNVKHMPQFIQAGYRSVADTALSIEEEIGKKLKKAA